MVFFQKKSNSLGETRICNEQPILEAIKNFAKFQKWWTSFAKFAGFFANKFLFQNVALILKEMYASYYDLK